MTQADSIKNTFDFLIRRAENRETFTLQQLAEVAGWTLEQAQRRLRNRLSDIIDEGEDGALHVRPEILRVRLSDFSELLQVKKRLFTDYVLEVSSSILIYEFFMPLSREDRLREALDSLFYLDSIEQRIDEIGIDRIRSGLKLPSDSSHDQVRRVVIDFMENTIGGYSIYTVNGRYRAEALSTRAKVAARPYAYGPYLVDEMTAIVRFVLPVESDAARFEYGKILEPASVTLGAEQRAEMTSWLVLNFFAEALIRVVQNEDEIWLIESGMRSAFYRWVRRDE